MQWFRYLIFTMMFVVVAGNGGATDLAVSDSIRDSIVESQASRTSELILGVQGATNVQIRFNSALIGPGARIRLIAKDGDEQEFDQTTLQRWNQQSAIFNGSSVRIQIVAPRGVAASYEARAVSIEITPLLEETPPGAVFGTDERVAVNDPRVGRISPEGCTGWLTSIGAVLTAGHCDQPNQILG